MDYPFKTAGLDSETIDNLFETYNALKSRFIVDATGHINFNLGDFDLFKHYHYIKTIGSYAIKNGPTNCYVLFTETHMQDVSPGSATSYRGNVVRNYCDYQTWAVAYLKRDFGRVLIRPETLADKIIELVHPIELDFEEDKAFSDTFYVLVNDRWKADAAMDRNFRNAVMDMRHESIVIEIVDHTLIVGYRKTVSPDTALLLADFVLRLCCNC